MAYIRRGYIFSSKRGRSGRGRVSGKYLKEGQCVWIVKYNDTGCHISIGNGSIVFPKDFAGKRVRLKVEFLEDDGGMPQETQLKITKKELRELLKKEFLRGFRSGKKDV